MTLLRTIQVAGLALLLGPGVVVVNDSAVNPVSLAGISADAPPDLITIAEQSGDTRTGRYNEVIRLCHDFESAFPGRARCTTFGTTPEGRPLVALVASDDGVLDAATARARGRAAIVIQGGIHAGEIDGKDAGFRVLREALRRMIAPGVLKHVTLVFIPVINPDGHERFGPHHRANQRGPEEMGWRTTAQNLNLNRDYAKADAPEMQALLRLLDAWDPPLYVDLHVTDGAQFRHDVALVLEPADVPGHPLAGMARALRDALLERVTEAGHRPLDFYPAFVKDDDPASGFAVQIPPPRFSSGYWGARDRLGLLVETHSWKTYPERVRATVSVLVALLEEAHAGALRWLGAARAADEVTRGLAGREVPLMFVLDPAVPPRPLEFLGFAWRREPSTLSGGTRIIYDETKPEIWNVPLRVTQRSTLTVRAPGAGYIVPRAYADGLGARLALHGFETVPIPRDIAGVPAEAFLARKVSFGATSYEGRQTAAVEGAWQSVTRDVSAGSLFVPIAQPGARLLLHLFEPLAPDSFVAWGFFNTAFERKEYMEGYVAEEIGADMLQKDPELRAEFEALLASDATFAADPAQRLNFFYRRSPYWDVRLNEVPILKVDRFAPGGPP